MNDLRYNILAPAMRPIETWSRRWLLQRLAEHNIDRGPLVFVDRPIRLAVDPWRNPKRFRHPPPGLRQLADNAWSWTPRRLGSERLVTPWLWHIADRWLLRAQWRRLSRAIPDLADRWSVLLPHAALWDYATLPERKRIVYICSDAHHVDGNGGLLPKGLQVEADLIRRCDAGVGVCRELTRRLRDAGLRSRLISNGVDYWHDNPPGRSPDPSDVRIVHVGRPTHLFDWDLLTAVARQRPHWRFDIVGITDPASVPEAARDLTNIHSLAPVPHPELPTTLARYDLGILMFRSNAYSRPINALKLYEYIAAGLPTVSTPLPESTHLCGSVLFAPPSAADFIAAVERALDPSFRARWRQERQWVKRFTFRELSLEYRDLLDALWIDR